MANQVDTRTKIEGKLFAERGPGGSLMFSSGYVGGVGDDEELHTELIISPKGIKELVALLVRDAQLRIGADDAGHSEAFCDCKTRHNFQEVAINHCFVCDKPLHS